jgi:ABC-type uncharacterized transport system involved in gliding motility auxiliary subunit
MTLKRLFSSAGLVVIAAVVLASTLIVDRLQGLRLDLTESKLYTLSDGTLNIVRNMPADVDLFFYFSHDATREALGWRNYAQQVRELLEELRMASGGRIKLHVIEPEPFSEEEDQAAEYGLEAVRLTEGGDPVYFGLAAMKVTPADKDGNKAAETPEVISFFQPDRQAHIEYDVAKLVYQAARAGKPKIAMISGLDLKGGWDMMTRQPTEPWVSYQQLSQLFEVTSLSTDVEQIGKEYSLLVLVHPKELPPSLLYAIDQYALQGGHVLAFMDPFAEQDKNVFGEGARSSELGNLLTAWGVQFDGKKVVGDYKLGVPVNAGLESGPVKHIGILRMTETNHASDDMIIRQLESINMSSAGMLSKVEGSQVEFKPLLLTTDAAAPFDAEKLQGLTNPETLMDGFKPSGERFVLAAQVSGEASSAFPAGAPVKESKQEDADKSAAEGDDKAATQAADAPADNAAERPAHVASGKIQVMVVADSDVLSDRMWVQVHQFFGRKVAQPFADNGTFLVNAVDVLAGSPDLISIRSRGRFTRPFTVVENMQTQAESEFREIEKDLKARLEATESKLNEMQNTRDDKGNLMTLTKEQQDEILKFQQEKVGIRKQLRDVQHQLNRDIENLELVIKVINITAVPAALTLLVLMLSLFRRRRATA